MSTHVRFCAQIGLIRRRAQRAFPKGRVQCNGWWLERAPHHAPRMHMLMQLLRGHEWPLQFYVCVRVDAPHAVERMF